MADEKSDIQSKDVHVDSSHAVTKKKRITKAENLKEKLAKARDERSDRILTLQSTHRHVCDMVSTYWEVDVNEIIDAVGDDIAHVKLLESFCKANGACAVIFVSQIGPAYEISTGRHNPVIPADSTTRRCYITNGLTVPLTGKAVIVYRNNNAKDVDMRTIADDVYFTQFDMSENNYNIVCGLYTLLSKFVTSSLTKTKEWGDLTKTDIGLQAKSDFLADYICFANFIDKTRIDLDELVEFDENPEVTEQINSPTKITAAVRNPDLLEKALASVRGWLKLIERVVIQFHQLRREDEFVGPVVEIEYWRRQLAKFTSVLKFTATENCEFYIRLISKARSRYVKSWKSLDDKVIEARNECLDNVKYLYTLETYYEPLYRCDPTKIPAHLAGLLNAIRLIYTTSRYYNNTSSITAILVKISNQIIIMCRNYINCNGTKTIWVQKKTDVIDKIKVCLDLYLRYYQCFKRIQKDMEDSGEQPFVCSEIYVFGKLETFKKRLERITEVFTVTVKYSILESSTIEGIGEFASRFSEFYKNVSTKKYDALNHRQDMFDEDYTEFKKNVAKIEWDLEEFVGNSLEKMVDVDNVVRLLVRFEKLDLPCLHLDDRYLEAIEMFQSEIEELRDHYNEERQNPHLPWNVPPVSGRIMWIRQLYTRIEEPMNKFKEKLKVMRHRKVQKCIQMFNSLSCVFVHYEQLYHKAWFKHIPQVRGVLGAPILITNNKTRRFVVNFDPYIVEAIRETEYIQKLDLPVPDVAQILVFCKNKILHAYEVVKQLVEKNNTMRRDMPKLFIPLLKSQLLKMQVVFMPALSTITWTSMRIPDFCKNVTETLEIVQMFLKEVTDIKEARIDEVFAQIAKTFLTFLPPEPIFPNELLQICLSYKIQKVAEIRLKLYTVEKAAISLVNKFADTLSDPEIQAEKYNWLDTTKPLNASSSTSKLASDAAFKEIDPKSLSDIHLFHKDCLDLFEYFNGKTVDCLVRATKLSLDLLRQRVKPVSFMDDHATPTPILLTRMQLRIPLAVINPTLDEIELHFGKIVNIDIKTHASGTIIANGKDAYGRVWAAVDHVEIESRRFGL
ncbi:dynein heavy chain 8, axonemal-like [Photinus pyralis]|uniref:dynein heavy chain 8, axonemal-like n=1 Tax=Photinus pyralis TaxID=7054 RepID=UPI0012673D22|nr:dynein heavy chain 8, axonemal-like [Photinus pyralis]